MPVPKPTTTPESVIGLFLREDMVLAVSRKGDLNDLGLIGGKLEPGESPEAALKREILEEIGVEVAWVSPADLLEPNCTFREYNRGLFDSLGLANAS